MNRIMFLIAIICAGLFAVPNHITMPPVAKENNGYSIPYTGYRQSPGDTVGMTDYDWMINGSLGRAVWVTPIGGFHFSFIFRFGGSNLNRFAMYNYHLPPFYWLGPTPVDSARRCYSIDQMTDGRAIIGGWAPTINDTFGVYLDSTEGAGNFTGIPIPWQGDPGACPIWLKLCVDDSDYIYVVGSQNGGPYAYWNMSTDEGVTWRGWDSTLAGIELNIFYYDYGGHEVWTQYGNKIALVTNMGDDYITIVYWESGDQGTTWSYDTVFAMVPPDSVQGYLWNSAIYDNNGCLHAAFTCIDTMSLGGGASGSGWRSQIRHWNQETNQISMVDNGMGWVNSNPGPGANHPTVSEPQIAINRLTGDLYCTWCYADPEDVAANGLVNMDIWGARSTDNGATWIEQHNITNSPSPGATAGNCDNDHANSLAEHTLDDTLVIFYLNDKDAGNASFPPDPGATLTDNPLLFYLYKWNPYGVEENSIITPMKLSLSVESNPFTRNTRISYTLQSASNVSLKLYSIDGRLVKTIHGGHRKAGLHKENVDCTGIGNGIYFVVLETATGKESCSVVVVH